MCRIQDLSQTMERRMDAESQDLSQTMKNRMDEESRAGCCRQPTAEGEVDDSCRETWNQMLSMVKSELGACTGCLEEGVKLLQKKTSTGTGTICCPSQDFFFFFFFFCMSWVTFLHKASCKWVTQLGSCS